VGRFDRFITALSRVELSNRACNQYARSSRENAIRRRNLRLYLEEVGKPRILLVGEAPSYRGGRLTGIPFTSESIMLCGAGPFLGRARGYQKAAPGPKLSTEASASMVWAAIRYIDPLPLLWNAFPFHPFRAGNPFSNRVPSAGELKIGEPFLESLIRLFPIERVIAVGNHADRSLTRLGIAHDKVRHPSQGGKRKFVEGVAARLSR
jgi:uracil-DNA glycosylase